MNNPKTILSLDPSSTCCGYALFDYDSVCLIDGGIIRPDKKTAGALSRVIEIVDEVVVLLAEYRPDVVLIEMPLEKQYTKTPGKKSGFALWGLGAGAIWATVRGFLRSSPEARICPITNTWTAGVDKDTRKRLVASTFKGQYKPKDDPGGDAADAIDMAWHWIRDFKRHR